MPQAIWTPQTTSNPPWESISMDFIEQLPVSEGFTAILVIVDRLTKQSLFIPTNDTVDAPQLARLFLTHVFSKHGTPGHVTSNHGTEFMSHFFRSLGSLLSMKLHFMSGYHPEGNGQTEQINQVLEQYLWAYTNYQQDNWAPLLPLVEFAYNNATSTTTGISPFFANKGYHPSLLMNLLAPSLSSEAQRYMVDLDQLHSQLKASIAEAQEHYQKAADTITSLQDWRSCICKSEVLPHNPTFEETGREEPGTVRDNRHPGHALHYSPPPTTIPRGTPHFPRLPT